MPEVETRPLEPVSPSLDSPSMFVPRPAFTLPELLAGLLALLVVWFAGRILLIAFAGFLLAVFLHTLARGLNAITFLRYGWALSVVVLLIVGLAGALFGSIGTRLISQANEFSETVPRGLRQIREIMTDDPWGQWILEQSPDWGRSLAQGTLPARITDLATSLMESIAALVIIIFIGVYGAAEPELYGEGLLRLVPVHRRARAREIASTIVDNLRWWILGQLFAMVCVGVITGIGLRFVDAPLVMTLAILAAVLEMVPNIGPIMWLMPAVLVSLTQGTRQVISIVVIYIITHTIESYIIIPLVQRRTVWLPPAVSILAVVLLGVLAGFLGLLVAAPLALVAMLLIKMLYVEDRLGDREPRVAR